MHWKNWNDYDLRLAEVGRPKRRAESALYHRNGLTASDHSQLRECLRERLASDISAFLRRGGQITQCPGFGPPGELSCV